MLKTIDVSMFDYKSNSQKDQLTEWREFIRKFRRFQIRIYRKLYRRIYMFQLIGATIVNLVVGSIKRIEKIYQEISRRFEIRIFRKLMEKSSSYRRIYAKNNSMFDYKSSSWIN